MTKSLHVIGAEEHGALPSVGNKCLCRGGRRRVEDPEANSLVHSLSKPRLPIFHPGSHSISKDLRGNGAQLGFLMLPLPAGWWAFLSLPSFQASITSGI